MVSLIICVVTSLLIVLSIMFFPSIKYKRNLNIPTYIIISLISALILIFTKNVSIDLIKEQFLSSGSVNPIKIVVLFLSMTVLSIFLDEIGFFKLLAIKAIKYFNKSQIKLFFGLYFFLSLLTVFTSNDIIILTFTPFICYYCKNTKINSLPYLILEFVSSNTFSMLLIVGNPTNIYLASFYHIDFLSYFIKMLIPTLCGGLTALLLLYLIFKKELKKEMEISEMKKIEINKFYEIIGLIHLFVCIILIAISNYLNFEMWLISLSFALSLLICASIYKIVKKDKNSYIIKTIKRLPWTLIPFVLSMFILVLSLKEHGYLKILSSFLKDNPFLYGIGGSLIANMINNIPMAVLFSQVLENASLNCLYAAIASSNIAAFITPLGALAGIMFMSLLRENGIKLSFLQFIKYGIIIAIPTLAITISLIVLI